MDSPELHPAVPPRTSTELTVRGDSGRRLISAAEFQELADVPAATEWLANVDNPNTRRAYGSDVGEFMSMLGVCRFSELPGVRRAHVIAWREMLEARGLGPATRCRKLSAVSSLFRYLCNANAVHENPVSGVRRPRMENANEGRTPALSDAQARRLLDAPEGDSLQARRDRALLAVLLYHGLRRDEVARLTVGSLHEHRGVPHFRVTGKGSKTRPVPVHPAALSALGDYLELAGHRRDRTAPLFQPTQARWAGRPLTGDGIYKLVRKYASLAAVPMERIVHALRATAATNALEHEADIAPRPGLARPRQRQHNPPLRPACTPARGQPHVPRQLLIRGVEYTLVGTPGVRADQSVGELAGSLSGELASRGVPVESLPTPRRGIGNPTAEEHVETVGTRLRGEGRCRVRLRQVAQDGPHLSVDRIEQNGHGEICLATGLNGRPSCSQRAGERTEIAVGRDLVQFASSATVRPLE